MKKHSIPFMALLLAAVFFGACGTAPSEGSGSGSSAGGGSGRYVETDVTPDGESSRWHLFRQPEEKLVCYDDSFANRYESADGGKSWQQGPGPGASDERFDGIRRAALLEDGSLVAELPNYKDDGSRGPSELVKVSPSGDISPLELEGYTELAAAGKDPAVTGLQALPGGRLLMSYGYGFGNAAAPADDAEDSSAAPGSEAAQPEAPADTEPPPPGSSTPEAEAETGGGVTTENQFFSILYDVATGKQVADVTEPMGPAAAASSDTLYLLGYGGEISTRKLSDGSAGPDVDASASSMEFNMSLGLDATDEGKLYLADANALTELGSETKKLMDGAGYAFGAPGTRLDTLLAQADGSFFMSLATGGKASIKRYTFDPDAMLDPSKSLRLWMLRENHVLRGAISEFASQNPGVTVEVEVALPENSSLTAEDAIKTLNTQMLAGEGPDLLVLDGCPATQYAEGGLLYDLTQGVDTSGMEEKLKSPFVGDKGTFSLPLRWQPPVLLGQSGALDEAASLDALLALVRQGKAPPEIDPETGDVFAQLPEEERPALDFNTLREAYDLLWNSSAPALFQNGKLEQEKLGLFLEALKTFSDKSRLTEYGEEGRPSGLMGISTDEMGSAVLLEGSALWYVSNRSHYGGFTVQDMQVLAFMDEVEGTEARAFPGLSENCWVPASLLAVNAASTKTELALAFVQCALSLTCQSQRVGGGLPVTAEGSRAQMAALQELQNNTKDADNRELAFTFDAVLQAAGQPMLVDESLRETVFAVAKAYCTGELGLEEAIAKAEKDTTAYLAERQS